MIVGTGIVTMAGWSLVRTALALAFGNLVTEKDLTDIRTQAGDPRLYKLYLVFFWLTIFIIVAAEFLMRMHVGLSAVAVGRGKEKGKGFIIATVFLILWSFIVMALNIYAIYLGQLTRLGNYVLTLLIEATSAIMMIEMVVSAIRLRRG